MWKLIAFLAVTLLFGCAEEEETSDPFEPTSDPFEPCVPKVDGPSEFSVMESVPFTFQVSLAEPFTCGIGAEFDIWDISEGAAGKAHASVDPHVLVLNPSSPPVTVTFTALPDADTVDAIFRLEAYVYGTIAGVSPAWRVQVIDGEPDPM